MRWPIVRTLLHKELLRHGANRGGLALAALLVVAAMLLSFFGKGGAEAGTLAGGVRWCFVDYWEDGPWIDHLRRNVPPELAARVKFRPVPAVPTVNGTLVYPPGTVAIQVRTLPAGDGGPRYKVWLWHPGQGRDALAPYEAWFWRESYRHLQARAAAAAETAGGDARAGALAAGVEEECSALEGGADPRSMLATALVLFALFFVCVYLLPSLTCEERERGVLLAQALSPASPGEILAAKCLCYPALAVALAALLAGICSPAALARPYFWLALGVAVLGSLGIGLTVASLARTQRSASMGALCYTMGVSLILFICAQNNLWGIANAALEYHCPRMLQAALTGAVRAYHWGHLAGAFALSLLWLSAATVLFRRGGWR